MEENMERENIILKLEEKLKSVTTKNDIAQVKAYF